MNIKLDTIIPSPLSEVAHPVDSVWNNDLELVHGMNYLIDAPSGKGKTTLLNIIYGIRKDYSGDLYFNQSNSKTFTQNNWSEMRKDKLSMVFQDLRLFGNLTPIENIELKQSLSKTTIVPSVKEMSSRLGIESLLNKPCKKLSFGQQQRVAIIRALQQPFEWLLLDEPFSHLDTENIRIASELIGEVCSNQNAGIVATTLGSEYPFTIHKRLII